MHTYTLEINFLTVVQSCTCFRAQFLLQHYKPGSFCSPFTDRMVCLFIIDASIYNSTPSGKSRDAFARPYYYVCM